MQPISDISDPRVVKALGHPLRIAILRLLDEHHTASSKELAAMLGESLEKVSYHVRLLAQLGVLQLESETPRGGVVERHYRQSLPPAPQQDFEQMPRLARDAALAAGLAQLTAAVRDASDAGILDAVTTRISHDRLALDPQGTEDVREILDRAVQDCRAAAAQSEQRSGENRRPTSVIVLQIPGADGAESPAPASQPAGTR